MALSATGSQVTSKVAAKHKLCYLRQQVPTPTRPASSVGLKCPPKFGRVLVACSSSTQEDKPVAKVVTAAAIDEEAPFLEPAVRSFALGVGAGVLLEFGHVLLEFFTAATAATSAEGSVLLTNLAALPEVLETLGSTAGPQVAWDNLLAVTCCALFYGMEVSAILPVLKKHGGDKQQVAKAINTLPTLPKRLMPVKLQSVKRALYALIALRNPTAALSQASAFLSGDNTGDQPLIGSPRAPRVLGGGVGTAVLERPRTPTVTDDAIVSTPVPEAPTKEPTKKNQKPAGKQGVPPTLSPKATTPPGRPSVLPPGTWDPTKALPRSKRARDLQERRAYLTQCWYAAALSKNLVAGKPLEVTILGRTVVLFRDENGVAHCLDNLCPHRGAPLSGGWVKQMKEQGTQKEHTCVVCPYHGWAFDGQGKLRDVPSSADQSHLPKRPLVDAYPVEEQGGFVYLFFGNKDMRPEERPPVPASFCPELSDPAWQPVYGEMEFDAPHFSVFDNALDMAHIHYLHSDSFGNSEKPVILGMNTKRDDWGIRGSFRIYNKPVNPLWEWTKVESVPVEFAAWLPATSYVKITLGAGVQMITYVNTVPIDDKRSVNRFALIRNFAGWEGFDVWAKNAMYKILNEDKAMVELLKPDHMPLEVSLEADLPQIAFRKLRQEWVDSGMLVDPDVTQGHTGSLDLSRKSNRRDM